MNRDNPLGMNGQVAESYGELIEKLWNGNAQSYTPRDFKYTIGKFNSSFYGYHQNDTQELLAFLLDGLHEDLNRIIKKPYIELPDFDGMKDKEIAERSWNYHRARNDSVIVDLFQGQFKSTLICAECKNVRCFILFFVNIEMLMKLGRFQLPLILLCTYLCLFLLKGNAKKRLFTSLMIQRKECSE